MGKFLGAIARFLFLTALLGLVGYNTWETGQLRREVEALRQQQGRVAVKEKFGLSGSARSDAASSPESLLASARRHYDSAQEHLGRKEYAEASREMMLATEAAKKASQNASALGSGKAREFQQAVQSLSSRAAELLDQGQDSGLSKPKNSTSK